MTALAFVDTPAAIDAARRDAPDAVLVTDNPLLAEDPRTGGAVRNIERLIDPPAARSLGTAALDIADGIDDRLQDAELAAAFGLVAGHVRLAGVTSRLLASLLHRAAVMAAGLAEIRPAAVALHVVAAPRGEPGHPLVMSRFATPYPALADHGFFAGLDVAVHAADGAVPARINDTSTGDWSRRAAMLPLPVLVLEMAERLGLTRLLPGAVVVGAENEAVRECLPWLALRGQRPIRRGGLKPRTGGNEDDGTSWACHPALDRRLSAWLHEQGDGLSPFTAAQWRAIVAVVLEHLSAGLETLSRQVGELRAELQHQFAAAGDDRLYLTNGLFGPVGAQIYGLCREFGMTVVDFEHGVTSGLAALSARKMNYSEATTSDVLLVCAPRAATAFRASGGDRVPRIETIGLADQTRRLLRPAVQRRLARRRLGISGHETTVMHVSTWLYHGNLRPGPTAAAESATFDLDRRLLTKVYPGLRHLVVFKQYPTQRLPHEPSYPELFGRIEGVAFPAAEDFRYVRAAADVIVTGTPTSTLGWCLGAGVPLVWLDSATVNPLTDEALRQAFRESFLFVDLDRPDWPEALRALLDRPLAAIRRDWADRAGARRALLDEAITGPKGSAGRRAARIVAALGRRESDMAAVPQGRMVRE